MIHVWHLKDFKESVQLYLKRPMSRTFPDGYVEAARIESVSGEGDEEALERAYRLTQNLDYPWVSAKDDLDPLGTSGRSTSVGDVISVGDRPYLCSLEGWSRLEGSRSGKGGPS